VASAIIIPEPVASPSASKSPGTDILSLKRRQSESPETDSKRQRLSTDDSVPPPQPKQDERQDVRRRNGKLEERKRGQRLFGALLGTLSQGTSTAAQKRREEIEKRQQEKLKQQQEEDSQRRKERLDNLRVIRKREQSGYDEKTMRLRHANMLRLANYLQTKAEPKLYYKPWDILPEQEEQIRQQVEDTQAIIDQELVNFEQRRVEQQSEEPDTHHTNGLDTETVKSNTEGIELTQEATDTQSRDIDESANIAETVDKPASPGADVINAVIAKGTADDEMREAVDENQGDMVVEAEEDTVIY